MVVAVILAVQIVMAAYEVPEATMATTATCIPAMVMAAWCSSGDDNDNSTVIQTPFLSLYVCSGGEN